LNGYNIDIDTVRAIKLLTECKDRNIDCKYELFKINYEINPEIAYQLISELALKESMTCYRDSVLVLNARLIAADMTERKLGNNEGLIKSAMWYLLYYEIEYDLIDRQESSTRGMVEEMIRVLKLLTDEQLDAAYLDAKKIPENV
jgi:hypothetical protein